MNQERHIALVEGLTDIQRAAYFVVRQHGPVTGPDLRIDGPREYKVFTDWNGKRGRWKGRMNGSTENLAALQSKGLIRRLPNKRDDGKPTAAWEYVVVPAEDVEATAEHYRQRVLDEQKARKPRNNDPTHARRRNRSDWSANLRDAAAYSEWHRHRRRVIELAQSLDLITPLLFVDALYDGHRKEFDRVLDEVLDVREWADRVISELERRDGRRALEHKRDAAQRHADDENGNEFERESARRKVRILQERLDAA